MHIFITGIAGFIGANAAEQLLKAGHRVTGIDNLNDYYDPQLKQARLAPLNKNPNFRFHHAAIEDPDVLKNLFEPMVLMR